MGKEGELQPSWSRKGAWWSAQALVGTGRLLFSTVVEGQTVSLIFQAASSAKLASPALAGMENCTGLFPPPPAFVLTRDLLLFC